MIKGSEFFSFFLCTTYTLKGGGRVGDHSKVVKNIHPTLLGACYVATWLAANAYIITKKKQGLC
jgi:hypothetical protein